jgi:hypothetical protein
LFSRTAGGALALVPRTESARRLEETDGGGDEGGDEDGLISWGLGIGMATVSAKSPAWMLPLPLPLPLPLSLSLPALLGAACCIPSALATSEKSRHTGEDSLPDVAAAPLPPPPIPPEGASGRIAVIIRASDRLLGNSTPRPVTFIVPPLALVALILALLVPLLLLP